MKPIHKLLIILLLLTNVLVIEAIVHLDKKNAQSSTESSSQSEDVPSRNT